jgi:hypothetical protein
VFDKILDTDSYELDTDMSELKKVEANIIS